MSNKQNNSTVETTEVKMYWSEGSMPVVYPNSQPAYWDGELEQELLTYPDRLISLFSSEMYRDSLGGHANARLSYTSMYKAFVTGVFKQGQDPYYWLVRREGKFYPLPMYWSELSDKEKKSIIEAVEILLSLDDDALAEFLEKN